MKNAKYFSASWCGPCKMFKPVVNELIQEGHPIEIIDVDENQELAQQYQVMSVPTIVVEENGQVTFSFGNFQKKTLQRLS